MAKIIALSNHILLDTSPFMGMLTILNALATADSVLIPVQAEQLPAKGLELLLKTIARVHRQINPHLEIGGILPTMVDERTKGAKEIMESLNEAYGSRLHVFSHIPRSVCASEISKTGKSWKPH